MSWRRTIATLLCLCTGTAGAVSLPAEPRGLELRFAVSCDFEPYFWSATVIYDEQATITIRRKTRGMLFAQQHDVVRRLHPDIAAALLQLAGELLDRYQIGRGADARLGAPREDERTFEIGALFIQQLAGRLDEVTLSIDLTRGRPQPELLTRIIATLRKVDGRLKADIDCT